MRQIDGKIPKYFCDLYKNYKKSPKGRVPQSKAGTQPLGDKGYKNGNRLLLLLQVH